MSAQLDHVDPREIVELLDDLAALRRLRRTHDLGSSPGYFEARHEELMARKADLLARIRASEDGVVVPCPPTASGSGL